jgi:polysaccharide pyruvyl transferase WcaK-like protein
VSARRVSSTGEGIRILVENGEYPLLNRGDIAMLSITVQRLRDRWPEARIGVLTSRPTLLRALVPQAEPVDCRDGSWLADGWYRRMLRIVGTKPFGRLSALGCVLAEETRRRLQPVRGALRSALSGRGRHLGTRVATGGEEKLPDGIPVGTVPAAVQGVSLVLAGGGGYLTDADLYQAHRTLNLLQYSCSQGIPTAMVGQGIGPMTDPVLLDRAAEVLPRVDLIALREGRRGTALLAERGVNPEDVTVTGDDAVEFGYLRRRPTIGSDLGLCIRVASYSKVGTDAGDTVGRVVREVTADLNAGIVPLMVSEHGAEDRRSTLPLLDGYHAARRPIGRTGTADELARQVAGCRVLVTSTYHVAVFALSQGIPVVALSTSLYYDDKFYGLAEMFGIGVTVVHLDSPGLRDLLVHAISDSWEQAPMLREPLQQRAIEQIAASKAAFERISLLVAAHHRDKVADTLGRHP